MQKIYNKLMHAKQKKGEVLFSRMITLKIWKFQCQCVQCCILNLNQVLKNEMDEFVRLYMPAAHSNCIRLTGILNWYFAMTQILQAYIF